jgi:hypothetical protein
MRPALRSSVSRVAPLEFDGRPLPLRLPTWALRLPAEGHVFRYLLPGTPDFGSSRGPWRYVEQMGAAHRLEADGVRLTVITRKRGPLFTEARLLVESAAPRPPGMEPRMGHLTGG